LSRNLGTLTSLNRLGHSRPVMGLIYRCENFKSHKFKLSYAVIVVENCDMRTIRTCNVRVT